MIAYFERFNIELTKKQAETGAHSGRCDDDIAYLLTLPGIKKQIDKIDPSLIVAELKGYGAWDDAELSDTEANKRRILWIACSDIRENHTYELPHDRI